MAREPKPLRDLLADIVSWGDRIWGFIGGSTFGDFAESELHQLAVVKCIEAIGEAAGAIGRHYPQFAADHPELELEAAYRARNRLSHGYDTIDIAIVWPSATDSVPAMVRRIRPILAALDSPDTSPDA